MSERSISRRDMLTAAGSLGTVAALAVPTAVVTGAEAAKPDPLRDMIAAYRAGCAAFNADPRAGGDDDDYTDAVSGATWEPPFCALAEAPPARTLAGAIDALRLACEELDGVMTSPIIPPLVAAALAFMERAEGDECSSFLRTL